MLLLAVPLVTLAFLFMVLPGLIWAWWCYPAADSVTRLSVGLAIGLALQIFLLMLLGIGPGITQASVALTTGTLLMVAVVLAWRFHLPQHRPAYQWRRPDLWLVLALVAMLIPRLIPLALDTIPQGWDPSFHSLLASTTVATGRLPTWMPYEPIPLNYPYGSHILMAAISLLTGVAPDHVLAALLDVLIPLATCLALYALTQRALRRHEIALAAVIAYGLLGNLGSLDYARWGGLPNAFGFFLFLAFLLVLFAPGFLRYRVIVGGILLGAVPLAHNHVMLTAVLILALYIGFLIVRSLGLSRHGREVGRAGQKVARRGFLRLMLTGLVALIASGFYVIPLLLRASQYGNTDVLRLIETVDGLPFAGDGWILWGLVVLGVMLLYIPLFGYLHVRQKGRGGAHLARAFVATALLALALAFCLGYYAYRQYSLVVYHQPFTAFTPSRFLTDMTYFLAIYAGIGLFALWNLGARAVQEVKGVSRLTSNSIGVRLRLLALGKSAIRVAIVCGILLSVATLLRTQVFLGSTGWRPGEFAPGEQQAFAWIQTDTPKNALIINLNPNDVWTPYFTHREVAYTPVPTDEFTGGYVSEKRTLTNDLLNMLQQPGYQANLTAIPNSTVVLAALAGRPVYILTYQPIISSQVILVQQLGSELIYKVLEGYSLLQQ